jgi:hypothetical protein
MTIRLYNKDTNALIGAIAEADFKVLTDALEEESETDNDYFIDQALRRPDARHRPASASRHPAHTLCTRRR